MTPEDRLRQMIEAARGPERAGGSWTSFAPRAHRALFMRRVAVASGALALVAIGAFSAVVLTADRSPDPVPPAERPAETVPPSPEPTPSDSSPTTEPTATAAAEIAPFEAELWFVAGERLSFGTTIVPLRDGDVSRRLENGSPAQRAAVALEALLSTMPGAFAEAGDTTAIPEGTRLLDLRIGEGTALVDLSSEFESGGGSLSMQLRVAQIVYTVTQVEGINGVRFAIEGREVDSIGGEGVEVNRPLDRSHLAEVAPPIVVVTPKSGSTISDTVVVSGHADVFEATVNIQILDENGKPLVETFTTATCGSGCRGDFSKRVRFSVDREQPGRVVALTYSAEDGSPQDVISVPVTLVP